MTKIFSKFNLTMLLLAALIFICMGFYSSSTPTSEEQQPLFSSLEHEATQAVLDFHQAINSGDEKRVRQLLADAVLIFEAGGVERSAEQYASHHLKSDIEFLSKMTSSSLEHSVVGTENMAVSVSRSNLVGNFRGKDRNINTMETLVLKKSDGQWKIIHIHWSN